MSEYQYYEFKAIDKALTAKQKEKLEQLSSRAEVSSYTAKFVYHYGDFRGDVEQLMRNDFDAMVYLANWGSRRLMFRLPYGLVDPSEWREFFISEEIETHFYPDSKNFSLDFNFQDDNYDSWIEGDGYLDDLQSLRADIIAGDIRVLYLAWLKACEQLMYEEDIEDDIFEPSVPAGLNQLNSALKQFMHYIELDQNLVKAAAQKSPELTLKKRNAKQLITQLSAQEQQQFLIQLSDNEANLSARLNQRLDELNRSPIPLANTASKPRSYQCLLDIAKNLTILAKKEQQQKVKQGREAELMLLQGRQEMMWKAVDDFIEQKNASAYDRATKHLTDLHDLAEFEKKGDEFNQRLVKLQETYSGRSALLKRFNSVGLVK